MSTESMMIVPVSTPFRLAGDSNDAVMPLENTTETE
jgi:hypothetical protein